MDKRPEEPLYDRLSQALAPWLPGIYLVLLWQSGWLDVLLPVSIFGLKVLGLLLVWEIVSLLTADPLTRALIRFRWRARRGGPAGTEALNLAAVIGMLRPAAASRGEAAIAYGKLTHAAVRLNMRHPNPISGPVTADRLTIAMEGLQPHLAEGQTVTLPPVPLAAIWPQPRPDFTLGGLVLEYRRSIGALIFGRTHRIIRLCIAGERAFSRRQNQPKRPAERWKAADFPQHEIWRRASRMAVASGLPVWNADPALLPLHRQRRLAAAALLLSSAPAAAFRARLLVPLDGVYLSRIRRDISRWEAIYGPLPKLSDQTETADPAYA